MEKRNISFSKNGGVEFNFNPYLVDLSSFKVIKQGVEDFTDAERLLVDKLGKAIEEQLREEMDKIDTENNIINLMDLGNHKEEEDKSN